MNEKVLEFVQSKSDQDLTDIYNFNVDVFAEASDLHWSVDALKNESKRGWKIYSVKVENEIVAVALFKKDDKRLLTKNTPIKMTHQGNGYSHMIKEFFEDAANELNVHEVVSLCSEDNFRLISLNETHGYVNTSKRYKDNDDLIEWVKKI
jgi:RimJ/RimL family protein N-acetyltransferase